MTKLIFFIFLLILGSAVKNRLHLKKSEGIIRNLIIFIGFPALIIHSLLSQPRVEFGLVAAVIAVSLIVNMIFSKAGSRVFNLENKGSFLLLNSFPNAGFLGLPLCWIVFGAPGLYYGSLYVLVGSLVHYSLGIAAALKEEKMNWLPAVKSSLKFPVIWVYFAILLLIFGFEIVLSHTLMSVLDVIGKAALYLIMFYIGLHLAKPDNIKKFYKELLYVGSFRFVVAPLIIFLPLFLLKIEGYQVLTFQAMMPPAIFNIVVASYYRLNEKLCANITTVLTILFLLGFIIIKLIGEW